MKIDSIKDLQKLIQMCKKTGVDHIKVGELEVWINDVTPMTQTNTQPKEVYAPGDVGPNTKIQTEELTPEQLLMWSSAPGGQQEQI